MWNLANKKVVQHFHRISEVKNKCDFLVWCESHRNVLISVNEAPQLNASFSGVKQVVWKRMNENVQFNTNEPNLKVVTNVHKILWDFQIYSLVTTQCYTEFLAPLNHFYSNWLRKIDPGICLYSILKCVWQKVTLWMTSAFQYSLPVDTIASVQT